MWRWLIAATSTGKREAEQEQKPRESVRAAGTRATAAIPRNTAYFDVAGREALELLWALGETFSAGFYANLRAVIAQA